MKCSSAQNLFSAAFDGELSVAEERELNGHLSSCPACSREYALFSKGVRLVSSLPKLPVNPFFEQKVLRELRAREAPSAGSRAPIFTARPAVALAAATVLLALFIVIPQSQLNTESELAMNELELGELIGEPVGLSASPEERAAATQPADEEQGGPARSSDWALPTQLVSSSPAGSVVGSAPAEVARTDGGSADVEFVLDPFLLEGTEIRRVEVSYVSTPETELVSMTF
jgi:hypothetical protein